MLRYLYRKRLLGRPLMVFAPLPFTVPFTVMFLPWWLIVPFHLVVGVAWTNIATPLLFAKLFPICALCGLPLLGRSVNESCEHTVAETIDAVKESG